MSRPQDRYQRLGLVLVVPGLALLLVSVPLALALLVLAAACFVAAVRGWPFPGMRPEPEQRLSRKARRYVEVEPEWSVDFLEPALEHLVPERIPFSGFEPEPTWFGTLSIRNAQREPGVDLDGIGADLAFYRENGTPVYDRIPARWGNNPFPPLRQQLEPEVRRLPASGEGEPLDVVARIDEQSQAYVNTADAARGGQRLALQPGRYFVRVRLRGGPDEPIGWYRVAVPLLKGLELTGPVKAPAWAPRPKARRAPAPKAAPRKKSGSSRG